MYMIISPVSQMGGTIMRRIVARIAILLTISAAALCQTPAASSAAANDKGGGFTPANLDRSIDPCVDFYQFACGTWRKNSPIPSDQPAWDSFTQVYVRNQQILRDILEKQSAEDPKRSPVERQIGDFYYACMDEKAINTKGIQALKPELDRTAGIQNRDQIIERMAYIQLLTAPSPVFNFSSSPDLHGASMVVADIDQGGITMPDRDYYIKDDEKAKAVREAYLTYLKKSCVLSGQSEAQA